MFHSMRSEFIRFLVFVMVAAGSSFAIDDEAALIVAMQKDPGNDTIRLAYADFLDERGGPGDAARAEFIRLDIRATRESDRALEYRRDRFLEEHRESWLPPVLLRQGVQVGWERGFVDTILLSYGGIDLSAEMREAIDAQPLLQGLTLSSLLNRDHARAQVVIADLNTLQVLPRLRMLTIMEFDLTDDMVGRIAWGRMRNLKALDLKYNRITEQGLSHILQSPVGPQLMDLNLEANLFTDGGALLTTTNRLPRLEALRFNGRSAFVPTAHSLPRLHTLDLGVFMEPGHFSQLLRSPLMPRLYSLHYGGAMLSDVEEAELLHFLRTEKHGLGDLRVHFPNYPYESDRPQDIRDILRRNFSARTDECAFVMQRVAEAPSE